MLGKLEREAESNSRFDPDLAPLTKRLQQAGDEIQDIARNLRAWTQTSEADPERQDEVETRVQLLRRLEAKYGKTIDELVEYRKTLDASEAKLVADEEGRDALEADIRAAFADVAKHGAKLGKERAKVAKSFVGRVQKELAELSMPEAKLDAELTPRPRYPPEMVTPTIVLAWPSTIMLFTAPRKSDCFCAKVSKVNSANTRTIRSSTSLGFILGTGGGSCASSALAFDWLACIPARYCSWVMSPPWSALNSSSRPLASLAEATSRSTRAGSGAAF